MRLCISVVSAQFCCEPKTTLKKNEVHFWKVKLALFLGFPGGSDSKESASSVKDPDSIPGLGRSPGKGNGNWLQYSCLENPMDGGAWQVTVQRVGHDWVTLPVAFIFGFFQLFHPSLRLRAALMNLLPHSGKLFTNFAFNAAVRHSKLLAKLAR